MRRAFVFLVFLLSFLFSGEINKTIVDNNITFYKTLLKKLDTNTTNKDEVSLQKTLLKKIIQLYTPSSKESNITKPKNQLQYKELFNTFLRDSIKKENLSKKINTDIKKIVTLYDQIVSEENTTLTQQLFYTFYTKERDKLNKNLKILDKELLTIQNYLSSSLYNITFNKKEILDNLEKIEEDINKLNKQIEQLKLKKEKLELLNKTKEAKEIGEKIENLIQKRDDLYIEKIKNLFLEFSISLKQKDNQAFKIHKEILEFLNKNLKNKKIIAKDLDNLLTQMEKSVFGTMAAIKGKGVEEVKNQIKNLWEFAHKPLFHINETPVSIFKLAIALLIFISGFLIGNFYKRQIKKIKNSSLTQSTRTLIANMGYYVIFIITFFIVLKVLGINLSSLALVAGALSVGIGFGLQNIISNFVSGLILMVERSVKIGDYIELDDDIKGHVVDIKMRSITLNTNENIDVIVPNQDLIQNKVINWTMNDRIRRFEIPFGVAYGTNPQKVIDVVLKAVKNSGFKDIYNTPKRHTRVVMTGMGDSSVDFALFVWIKGEETLYPKRTISRFLILVYNTLYENNIEIPFPQRDLHIRSISKDIPLIIKEEKNGN